MSKSQKGVVHLFVLLFLVVGIGIGLYLIQNPAIFKPKANQDNLCKASDPASFKTCLTRAENPSDIVTQIEITKQIICTSNTECSFSLTKRTSPLIIFASPGSNAGFKRIEKYNYNLLTLGNWGPESVNNITLKDLIFDETTTECSYIQPGTAHDINPECNSPLILGPKINNSTLDHITILHAKSHGIQIRQANNLIIKNSIIFDSGANGMWFDAAFPDGGCGGNGEDAINNCEIVPSKANYHITIENNLIADSHISAVEFYGLGTAQNPSRIKGNLFVHNHRDALYVACPYPIPDPQPTNESLIQVRGAHCPGGQLGISRIQWLVIEDNTIRDGRIDTIKPNDPYYPAPGVENKTYDQLGYTSTAIELGAQLKNLTIQNNKIYNITGAGIFVDFINAINENVNITGNVIYGVPYQIAKPGVNNLDGLPGYNVNGNILNNPSYPIVNHKAFLFADPPVCTPTSGTDCTSEIKWYSEGYSDPRIFVSGNLFAAGPNGSQSAPWVNQTPMQMNLCVTDDCLGTNLLDSIWLVGGKRGQITAFPNPCIPSQGQPNCKSTISWSVVNPEKTVQVRVREIGALFAQTPSGTQDAPWIGQPPLHLDLYEGETLIDTVIVQSQPH